MIEANREINKAMRAAEAKLRELDKSIVGVPDGFDAAGVDLELKKRWQASIDQSLHPNDWSPDYAVYRDPRYNLVLPFTFRDWSRATARSVVQFFRDISVVPESILDLYGGIGHCSAFLASVMPDTKVYYHNDVETQVDIASKIFDAMGLNNVTVVDKPVAAEAIIASELLEHFIEPWKFIGPILTEVRPKYFFDAPTYTKFELGHFPKYIHGGQVVESTAINRLMSKSIRTLGYEQSNSEKNFVRKNFFNSKPKCWVRLPEQATV